MVGPAFRKTRSCVLVANTTRWFLLFDGSGFGRGFTGDGGCAPSSCAAYRR